MLYSLLFKYIVSNYGSVALYLLLAIFDSLFALLSVFTLIPVLQFIGSEQQVVSSFGMEPYLSALDFFGITVSIYSSLLVFTGAMLLSSVFSVLLYISSRVNGYNIQGSLTLWAIHKFYAQGLYFINGYPFGFIQNTFNREIVRVGDAIFSIINLAGVAIFTVTMISFSANLSPMMTLIILVSQSAILLLIYFIGNNIAILSSRAIKSANVLSHKLYDPILNSKNIISFGREEWAINSYDDAFNKHASDAIKSQAVEYILPEVFKTLTTISVVGALFYALSQGEDVVLLVTTLVVFIRMLPKVSIISKAYAMLKNVGPSIEQYVNLFPTIDSINYNHGLSVSKVNKSIDLRDISFSYPGRDNVLSGVNIQIKANSYVVFVGHSGSGKTTCVDIIMGLYSPVSGDVLVDGVPLTEINKITYLNMIGYVQQEAALLSGTIRDNLLWAKPDASIDDMWESLSLVEMDNFIQSLPDQLDTSIGDRGCDLSGGQKQRLALSLALIRKPKILILDEITSSLDHDSEIQITKLLSSIAHNIIIISVTHKPVMAKQSDYVYVFGNGTIVESGSYIELIKNSDSFLSRMAGQLL